MWLRLRQIALITTELAPVLEDLQSIFGLEVCHVDPGVGQFGLENALLPVGNQIFEVLAPIRDNTAGGRYLERRKGDGGYMVITQTDDHERRKRRVAELGIRTVLQAEGRAFHNMQLHPKDTGGSFFEIDWHEGGEDPAGPWQPAGPSWQEHRRTEVVSAIRAAEIQAPEREKVARRWSEIAEIPVERVEDHWEIPLENARLRFVTPSDGRPEGLGGVDLAVVDRERLLRAAAERGRRVSDDLILVCGTRFRLVD